MRLTVARKTDQGLKDGAVNLNIILVGQKNVSDATTQKGRTNLNTLFKLVRDYFNQSTVGLGLGAVSYTHLTLPTSG